ncbi:MAG TPA: hypothetical protein VLF90_01430 [Patescibacteria group bacterium]|nr:hypothetical protein [Patescibacteria group bacterium]
MYLNGKGCGEGNVGVVIEGSDDANYTLRGFGFFTRLGLAIAPPPEGYHSTIEVSEQKLPSMAARFDRAAEKTDLMHNAHLYQVRANQIRGYIALSSASSMPEN